MPDYSRIIRGAIFVALTVVPTVARGQNLEVKGPTGLNIYVVTDRGRVMLGTVGADANVNVPLRLVDSGKQFEVVIENLPEVRSVAFVERGRTDEVCQDNSPVGSLCRHTGTFFTWGRLRTLSLSPTGEVLVEGTKQDDDDDNDLAWGVGWLFSVDAARMFLADRDRLCANAKTGIGSVSVSLTCSSKTMTDAWSGDIAATFGRFVALKVGYLDVGRVSFDIGGAAAGVSVTSGGHLGRTQGVTVLGALRVDVGGGFVPFGEAGYWGWHTTTGSSLNVTGPTPFSFDVSVDDTGWDPILGGGAEFWFVRNVGIRAGVRVARLRVAHSADLFQVDDKFRIAYVGVTIGKR